MPPKQPLTRAAAHDRVGWLAHGLRALGIDLSDETQQRLLAYSSLLTKWNRTYNLSAARDEERIISHHLLDSLAILPHLRGASLVDIGSGGGLPGIPLALARPQWRIALVEATHKKASFLRQAVIELGMKNVSVHNVRAEAWLPCFTFDIVIARALTDLDKFVGLSKHVVAPGGRLYAMKGAYPHEEIAKLPAGYAVREVVVLEVPQVAAVRHLVVLAPIEKP